MSAIRVLADRRHLWAFVAGCIAVTTGVLLHLPMFWMGRHDGFRLADMPMDAEMLWGMALIVAGLASPATACCRRSSTRPAPARRTRWRSARRRTSPLGRAHWRLMIVLTVALVIDVMKPASLGFVVPGMRSEYAVSSATVAWLPFAALCGTVVGSVLWGWLADLYGRRASILLSAVMFVGTSICGSMPSLWWNVGMCFLMGAAAGGMLPVTYALLAETMPSKQRGWALVLVGGLGAVGGYLAASALSAWLQPIFGWRILWFLNLPTGLILIFLNAYVPESPKFLLALGRVARGARVLRASAASCAKSASPRSRTVRRARSPRSPPAARPTSPRPVALSIAALAWGLINFGLLLWMPAHLVAKGYSMGVSSGLLAASALIAVPTVFVAAWLYSRWSSKGALVGSIALCGAGLRRPDPPRAAVAADASPVLRDRAADRRHQRDHRHDPAVRGRELSAAGARPRHRLGRRLHQGRRPGGAAARPARPRPGARLGGGAGAGAGADRAVPGHSLLRRDARARPARSRRAARLSLTSAASDLEPRRNRAWRLSPDRPC